MFSNQFVPIVLKRLNIYYIYKMFTQAIKKVPIFILLFWVTKLPLAFSVQPDNIQRAIHKIEAITLDNIKQKQIPGAAIAVVYQNKIIFMKGYGFRTLGNNENIDPDTLFQLGSISKSITATLAAVLETKGLLNLDNPVITYLPEFHLNSKEPPNALKITHILSHSSGLSRQGFNNMIESFKSHQEIVDALQTKRVTAPVGKKFDYHNAMFSLFSDITEAATHKKFEEVLATYLLSPLNMTQTTTSLDALLANSNRAHPHTHNETGILIPEKAYSKAYYAVIPSGGMNSSVKDMAIFLNAQMEGYPELINSQALDRIQTAYIKRKASDPNPRFKNPRYGLGWSIVDYANHTLIFHGGRLKGFTNYIAFMPDQKLGIVILHNGDSEFSSQIAKKFFEMALGLPEIKHSIKSKKQQKKALKKVASF